MVVRTAPPQRTRTAPPPPPQLRQPEDRERPLLARAALWLVGGIVCLGLVGAFLVGLVYLRLVHSPVSADYLAGPIQAALNADLEPMSVSIKGAEVRLTDGGRVELNLKQVRLTDTDGLTVAVAPEAAVEVSPSALLSLRISPARIDLIEPKLLLFYSADAGLMLSLARPNEAGPDGATPSHRPAQGGAAAAPGQGEGEQSVDLLRMLASATRLTRKRESATSTLESFGLRRATVILDIDGNQSTLQILSGELDLQHKHKRSLISGRVRIAAGASPLTVAFQTEAADRSQSTQINATVTDVVPSALIAVWPQMSGLAGIDVPVSARARINLSPNGELLDAGFEVDLGKGEINPPGHRGPPAVIEKGTLRFGYSRATGRITVEPSTIQWDANQATVVGELRQDPKLAGAWRFELATAAAVLAAPEHGLEAPVQKWTARGFISPSSGIARLEESVLAVAGSEFTFSGEIAREGDGARRTLDGKVGPLTAEALKAVWPRFIAGKARNWMGGHLKRGRIQSATLNFVVGPRPVGVAPADHHGKLNLLAEASDAEVDLGGQLPPVELPKVTLRIDRDALDVSSADARMPTAPGRAIALKGARLQSPDIDVPDNPGEITFKALSNLQAAIDLAERESGPNLRKNAGLEAADGKVEGQFRVRFPMREGLVPEDFTVEGKGRITDIRAKGGLGPYDVQGGTLGFDLTDQLFEVKGDLLVNGVIARVTWRHVPQMPPETQRPLTIEATLEAQDRVQLGLDVNHLVKGPVPIQIVVPRGQQGEGNATVTATLDGATLTFDGMAWSKPPGSPSRLSFDITRGQNKRVELQNLKLVAEDLAIEGWVALGPDSRPREFHFPSFSAHVVGQLDVQGRLRPDNVWELKATGARYDGRNIFRSMFSVGGGADARDASATRPGLDLTAEIDTVLGFGELSLRRLKLRLSRRGPHLVALDASGVLDGGQPLLAQLRADPGRRRLLLAESPDAGRTFKLVGFYPNVIGGHMNLEVDLDGRGPAERTGILWVQNFRVLGDVIVTENAAVGSDDARPPGELKRTRATQRVVRQQFDFERMRVPFSVGHGQFVMHDAYVLGPIVGATIRGKLDFTQQRMSLNGTYVPLSGLNRALSGIPIIGDVLTGPRGEGVLAITFAVEGAMANPQVIVNPLSMVAPGIFRDIFQMGPQNQRITPRDERGAPAAQKGKGDQRPQSSSSPPLGPSGQVGDGISGWAVETSPGAKRKP